MATPQEKLADALETLKALQDAEIVAIQSEQLGRTHRETLLRNGFIKRIIKGWYIPMRPDDSPGDTTTWYAAFWPFCGQFLEKKFKDHWIVSPEQSISLHAENWRVPTQLVVRTPVRATNNVTQLDHDTSLLDIRAELPEGDECQNINGIRCYTLPSALVNVSASFFRQQPTDARAALARISDASEILEKLLEGQHSTIAGRLAGAFRNIGREKIADNIIKTMRAAGYTVNESDPFDMPSPVLFSGREISPYASRIKMMWQSMRDDVLDKFPQAPGITRAKKAYMDDVEERYVADAYHSLSIEGYRVTPELIERVRNGVWNPDSDEEDKDNRDALAALGYRRAFNGVKSSIEQILTGTNPGEVIDQDHGDWYMELFGPSTEAGLLRRSDLAGYRSGPVYIRNSMHVPPGREAVRDAMPVFFDLLRDESEAAVRAVLGHFVFVYIHPYFDGNGRMGRFLMNAMMASGGYPWTIIEVERRNAYMKALESASVDQDIKPFARFLAECLQADSSK